MGVNPLRKMCVVLVAALALSGAAEAQSQPQPQSFPRKVENVAEPTAGQALVVGSIHFIKDGAEDNKCSVSGMECLLLVLPSTSQRAMVYIFKRGGDFAWSLPPGDYMLLEFQRWDHSWFSTSFRTHFTIPADAKAAYIGDFFLAFSGYRSIAGYRDAYDETLTKFGAAHPALAGGLVKALVAFDKTLSPSGEVTNVCAEQWKLTCTKNLSGITPQAPSDGKGFDLITGLTPEFRWNASADSGVTYDLALYEAASYSQDAFSKQYTEGRLIAYAKGLAQPSWQPEQPLEPDRRYFWSVRLRRGENVSSWSTYSYFNFFLVGFSSGYGQWFRFITPAK